LADNKIRSIEAFPETWATYLGLCEKSRYLHDQCPIAMKNVWICFGHWSTDNGSCAEVVLKIKLDGPLLDRDNWMPKFCRAALFTDCREKLKLQFPDMEKAKKFANYNWSEAPTELLPEACEEMAKLLKNMTESVDKQAQVLKFCQTASPDQLLTDLSTKGRLSKIDAFVRFFRDSSEDLVLVDENAKIAAVKIENGKVVEGTSPSWLQGLVLYRENRKISYGDRTQNFKVDFHSERHRFRQQSKANQRTIFNSQFAQRKRAAEYYDNRQDPNGNQNNHSYNTREENHDVGFSGPSTSNTNYN